MSLMSEDRIVSKFNPSGRRDVGRSRLKWTA